VACAYKFGVAVGTRSQARNAAMLHYLTCAPVRRPGYVGTAKLKLDWRQLKKVVNPSLIFTVCMVVPRPCHAAPWAFSAFKAGGSPRCCRVESGAWNDDVSGALHSPRQATRGIGFTDATLLG